MKTIVSLMIVVALVGWVDLARAQEDETGSDTATEDSGAGDSGKEEEKKDSASTSAADPWEAPKAAEEPETQPQEATPEVVVPRGYPVSEIDRPLALPRMTLEPRFAFELHRVAKTNITSLQFGAGFGVIDHLEAGLMFPLILSPKFDAGDMPIYGMYEFGPFLDGKLRAAGRLTLSIPINTHFWMLADAPVKFKLHDMFAVIGGIGLGVSLPDNNKGMLLNIDMGALFQPIEPLAVSLTFGLHFIIADSSGTFIPLFLRGQYTLIGDLDVYFEFGFGDLNHAGADDIQVRFGAMYRFGF